MLFTIFRRIKNNYVWLSCSFFYNKDDKNKMDGQKETKIVNDIVHGIIKLPDYIRLIIDTEQFQRLRHISQLGFCQFVYPSASYSRFEHSIGTFYLASLLMTQLRKQENVTEEILTKEEIKCVEIAALCHDLGHGPFSHTWEHICLTKEKKSHEKLSVEIFKDLIKNPSGRGEKSIKDEIGLDGEMVDRIERIILGQYDKERDSNKRFLFEIVANKRSGLDVDKFDYLCRDSIYLGWANKNKIHDIKRIMYFLRVVNDKDGKEWRLAVRDREIFHIYDIFYYRHLLHRYGYQHKTVLAIECMIKNALKNIDKLDLIKNVIGNEEFDNLKLQKGEDFTDEDLSSILHSSKFISKACDYHIWDILSKTNSNKVKKILDDFRRRKIYKLFRRYRVVFKDNVEKEKKSSLKSELDNVEEKKKIRDSVKSELEKSLNGKLKGKFSVFVVSSDFALSSEKGNPIYEIPLYKKESQNEYFLFTTDNPQPDLMKYTHEEIKEFHPPDLMKYTHEEINLLIFTDKNIKGDKESDKIMSDNINEILNKTKLKYKEKELDFIKLDY